MTKLQREILEANLQRVKYLTPVQVLKWCCELSRLNPQIEIIGYGEESIAMQGWGVLQEFVISEKTPILYLHNEAKRFEEQIGSFILIPLFSRL